MQGNNYKILFSASTVLGPDTVGKTPIFRFCIVSKKWSRENQKSEPNVKIAAKVPLTDSSVPLKPISCEFRSWTCGCCKSRKNDEYSGWYADLVDNDKVIFKTQSSMYGQETSAIREYLKNNK